MAENLINKGEDVIVYDIDQKRALKFKNPASSIREVTSKCRRIITMLPDSSSVEEAYLGNCGIFAGSAQGSLFIDCSTIEPLKAKSINDQAQNSGFSMIDAPVSGGMHFLLRDS